MQEKIWNWETNASPPAFPKKNSEAESQQILAKAGRGGDLAKRNPFFFSLFTCIPAAKFPNPWPWEGEDRAWPLRKAGDNDGDTPVAETQPVPAPGQGEMHGMGTGGTTRICRF